MWIWLGRRERHKIPASTGTLLLGNEAAFMLLLLGECWSRLHAEIQILWTTIGPATPALVEAERQWRYLVAPRIGKIHMSCALHGCRPKANRAFARSATPTYAFLQIAWRTLLRNSGRFRGITWEVELSSELLNRVELHRGDLFQHTLAPNMKPVGDLRLIYTSAKLRQKMPRNRLQNPHMNVRMQSSAPLRLYWSKESLHSAEEATAPPRGDTVCVASASQGFDTQDVHQE